VCVGLNAYVLLYLMLDDNESIYLCKGNFSCSHASILMMWHI
jgi:hypothetical protein